MPYLEYAAGALLGLMLSYLGFVFAMASGLRAAFIVGALLLLSYGSVIFYIIRKVKSGKGYPSGAVLALPMFLMTGVLLVGLIGLYVFSLLIPDTESFISECKATGAQFSKPPSAPVRSIAYDWDGKYTPPFNRFEVMYGTRIKSLGISDFPHPQSIAFIERKRSNLEGRPAQGPDGPYIRFPPTGPYYSISAPTADVLVHYKIGPEEELRKSPSDQGIVRYEVTVTDRRTSETLATLRYVIDAKHRRGCGLTGENTMNVHSFVLKAIGLEPA